MFQVLESLRHRIDHWLDDHELSDLELQILRVVKVISGYNYQVTAHDITGGSAVGLSPDNLRRVLEKLEHLELIQLGDIGYTVTKSGIARLLDNPE